MFIKFNVNNIQNATPFIITTSTAMYNMNIEYSVLRF